MPWRAKSFQLNCTIARHRSRRQPLTNLPLLKLSSTRGPRELRLEHDSPTFARLFFPRLPSPVSLSFDIFRALVATVVRYRRNSDRDATRIELLSGYDHLPAQSNANIRTSPELWLTARICSCTRRYAYTHVAWDDYVRPHTANIREYLLRWSDFLALNPGYLINVWSGREKGIKKIWKWSECWKNAGLYIHTYI